MLEVVIIVSAFFSYIFGMFKLLTTLGLDLLPTNSEVYRAN